MAHLRTSSEYRKMWPPPWRFTLCCCWGTRTRCAHIAVSCALSLRSARISLWWDSLSVSK
jgi:hypothetical protein